MASTADTWELHPQRRMSHSHRDSADTTLSASVTPLTAEIGVPGSSLYLFSIRGRDQPGISHLMCQTIADFDQSTLLDISQICIDELLMLSLLVKVDDEHVAALTKELLLPANRMGVSVSVRQLHDDSGTDSEGGERPASLEGDDGLCGSEDCLIQVVYHPPKGTVVECLPPALLLNVCSIATREGWSVVSVVHFNPDAPLWVHSLQLRVRQTGDFHPEEPIKDDIYNAASHPMGSRQRLYLLLQEVCHRVGAEVVVRPYEAPSKPKPKSLVVFGLSEVLVSNDVLMTLLKEAGKDYEGIRAQCEKQKLSVNETSHRLVAALEGASRDVVSRTIAQLRLTKGARKVCQALKYLGFKLALITSSASQSIARHVQSELGLDYALATEIEVDPNTDKITGKHGTLMDNFRKVDYMRLIADRENISQENVIVVGDYVHADYLFDQCGYRIHFNSRQQGDLRVLLHLLGYSETHVRELVELSQTGPNDSWNTPSIEEQLTPANSTVVAEMDTTSQDDSDRDVALVRSTTLTDPLARSVWDLEPLEGVSPDSALERCDIRVIGPDAPGLMELLLGPVVKTGTSIGQIVTYNLHGVFCMGMQIYVTDPESRDDCLKDILFITHGRGMDMQYSTQESLPTLPSFADLENPTGHSPSDGMCN
ncbi:phosphoserine phosphatase, putative [Perkinsus marinus ATCC 50983]|uniref:phosphoserine phosphatase n=1 Tax=Perkinsus marinus (strain ATCC 50983 / TXsc) TaxID=423536 RepID=C5LBB5_PERM5|nr:phosphoserine phosphatase, putative [Perkinsus marinus ATCC 50983]EER06043.1 phosphoserine phosphatase, putative [Perkinsus marinus ATCC 50983]|eukprot:XP_002774227.1 phosphoserine phosphatase, putative [Perkinsus marinus ATCC 50983]